MCKCDISVCRASCCYNVPMDASMFKVYKAHIQTKPIRYEETDMKDSQGNDLVIPIVSENFNENKCPFLKKNCKCAIYERRPRICRIFGTPPKGYTSKFLKCGWLNGQTKDNMIDNADDVSSGLSDLLKLSKVF